jgi:hypothetical protein
MAQLAQVIPVTGRVILSSDIIRPSNNSLT